MVNTVRHGLSLQVSATILVIRTYLALPRDLYIIQMAIGDRTTNLGYNLMGPAYDVGLALASRRYPKVFGNITTTRYFIPGEGYSCAESTGKVVEGLFVLLSSVNKSGNPDDEFRVVFTPGCTFEVMALGDFARDAIVAVVASSASVPTPEKYPVVLPLSATSYSVVARTVAEILKRFSWWSFNLLCDKNRDPIQIQAVEVICSLLLNYVQNQARQLSVVVNYFDSADPQTYKTVLVTASLAGMITGEYAFLILPLSPFESLTDLTVRSAMALDQDAGPLIQILPFVFQLEMDEINWNAIINETKVMDDLSRRLYNWTVVPERQRNVIRLAALESVQAITEVIQEHHGSLQNISAQRFVSQMAARTFNLPSRQFRTGSSGSRLCDILVKQYRNGTTQYETIFIFDNNRLTLRSANESQKVDVIWPSAVKFPPDYLPLCDQSSGALCLRVKPTDGIATLVTVFLVVLVVAIVAGVFSVKDICSTKVRDILVSRGRCHSAPHSLLKNFADYGGASKSIGTRTNMAGEGYSCAESTGKVIEGLFVLLPSANENDNRDDEFRAVLTPGCTFEIMTLGDFARESNVAVVASSASVPTPEKYPVVLALSATSYSVLARTVAEILKRFSWWSFNLLCDKNRDPIQIQAVEVICSLLLNYVQNQARQLSVVVNYFNSADPQTYKTVLRESKKHSCVSVIASYPESYKILLATASLAGMATGEYVFLVLPLSPFESLTDLTVRSAMALDQDTGPLIQILPFVFQLETEEINWDAIINETKAMDDLSRKLHNWTVVPERQHNVLRLAALESVQAVTEVIQENYGSLQNISAQRFVSEMAASTFNLPSRQFRTGSSGSRLCDILVKQYRNGTAQYETILVLDNNRLILRPANGSQKVDTIWPSAVKFPPDYLPLCDQSTGAPCLRVKNTYGVTTPVAVSLVVLVVAIAAGIFLLKPSIIRRSETRWFLAGDVIPLHIPYSRTLRIMEMHQNLPAPERIWPLH